jgi:cyanophycinase
MRKRLRFSLVLLLALSWGLANFDTPSVEAAGSGYTTALVGNPANVTRTTSGGIGLMGGGTDVDAAFRWMITKSGGGDFVVLRASGTDAYNPYIYTDLGGVDSVETIIVTSRTGASNSYVTNAVRNAEALFIAGGDQSNYWNYWRGTPLEDALQSLVAKNVPIGGTSAGLHVLGEFVYTALNTSATSATTLANPYDRSVTLGNDFLHLPNLNKVITDSHFSPRDRMGRLVGFLARLV